MSLDVLLVEDNPGDARLVQQAFGTINRAVQLHVAADGNEAMAFLKQDRSHPHAPRPALILLDLTLPKMNGHEVLAYIKHDDDLKTIPTVILTGSHTDADIERAYQLGANCYISKPGQPDDMHRIVNRINDFWLTKVKLPLTVAN
ncbi:MAG TPA: response regulator [Steroidobacteraceae bacterium]|jgi:CheY-like chemotaxis protein|nr:response regulator [Steroidobacteraceae bacterium]